MLARNLLFSVVCLAAVAAVTASVASWSTPHAREAIAWDADSVRQTAHAVNAAFRAAWKAQGLEPAGAADELTVARRISLGLTGTVPSLEEIRRIEAWPQGKRIDRWLAETLADRRYADFVAERLARAFVGVDDGPFLLFRRRRFVSWLSDQMAVNEPYDRIVRHLIADSGLWTDTPATNFVTVTIDPEAETGPDESQLAARVARAFLGVRIDCAECHDHPFESWKQSDFQGLAAFFGQTQQSLRGIRDAKGEYEIENRESGKLETIACRVPYQPELLPASGSRRERLAGWVTHHANRSFTREAVNRAWAMLFGRPLVEPIDNLSAANELPPALDVLADDFAAHHYDFRRLIEVIAATEVFRLDSQLAPAAADAVRPAAASAAADDGREQSAADGNNAIEKHQAAWAAFPLTRLRPEQVVGALLQSASLSTIDASSHILVRFARTIGQNDFVRRYGDSGAEEFAAHGGTIPQRLVMMNGEIVFDKTKESLLANAATRIATLAPDDKTAVEIAFLAVLTRRPDDVESRVFVQRLAGTTGSERNERLGDLYWALLNGAEFSWNH
ncbi:MAG: DUF1549 domain-containing protein [Pirellulales bacterium]